MTEQTTERTFSVSIECNNAAFEGDACGPELARILRALADTMEGAGDCRASYSYSRDANGNSVGTAEMTQEEYRR